MTGKDWHADSKMIIDEEKKITEFDYENFIHPSILKNCDKDDPEFKKTIRALNIMTKTEYEKF